MDFFTVMLFHHFYSIRNKSMSIHKKLCVNVLQYTTVLQLKVKKTVLYSIEITSHIFSLVGYFQWNSLKCGMPFHMRVSLLRV